MKVLLITNSARGEAIADALARSPQKPEIIAASTVKSPGLLRMCKEVHVIDIMSFSKVIEIARAVQPDFAFIAPDDPIGGGLADRLNAIGVPCVAPKKSLARIESSKSFARNLMEKYKIDGSPLFRVFSFTSMEEKKQLEHDIHHFITKSLGGQYVVKYDALKGGKGVKVSGEHLATVEDGVAYAMECITQCGSVVVEEKLVGVEFSLLSFVSGEITVDMPAIQDHKRAFEGDTGPNTGGMGTYTDANHSLPFLTEADLKAASELNRTIAAALEKECDESYKGILYGGFMVTKTGVKVIEYNARFGDPEALNVLSILESDFVTICQSIIKGTLTPDLVRFSSKATVCKYIVPKSYPEAKKESGQKILVPEKFTDDVRIFYGDVVLDDSGNVLLKGSRAVGIVGIGETIAQAESVAEEWCKKFGGPVRYRSDIGTSESIQKKVESLQKLREKSANS